MNMPLNILYLNFNLISKIFYEILYQQRHKIYRDLNKLITISYFVVLLSKKI